LLTMLVSTSLVYFLDQCIPNPRDHDGDWLVLVKCEAWALPELGWSGASPSADLPG
jgi:hypothetical protein